MTAAAERVLVLGGTGEATALAGELQARGYDVTLSLMGLTDTADRQPVPVRLGGFGGPDGLAAELERGGYRLLVDASHPFAARLAANAEAAAARAGVPRLRLLRPAWEPVPGDRWHEVADLAGAREAVAGLGVRRVFLSVGRVGAGTFGELPGLEVVVRTLTPPAPPPVAGATVVVARGPFTVDGERRLLAGHRVEALVTRNSGGSSTGAKLEAARELGLPVVMVRRPAQPAGDRAGTVADALAWAEAHPG